MRRALPLSLLLIAAALTTAPALRAQPAPAAPAATPPRLIEFVEAPYPPEALAARREGAPVLVLDIDAEGKVTAAVVVEPAGSGFDEAAQAAALRFRFEPARRGDQPSRSRIRYRYAFKLPAPEQTDPAAAQPAGPSAPPAVAARGRLAGRIVLHGADAPLAGARVVARLGDGSVREARTDLEGNFAMDELPPGAVSVQVEAPGYLGVEAQELVEAGAATEVTYRLRAPQKTPDEVVVKAARPDREVTRRTMDRKELGQVPGTGGDALRAVQSMPGMGRSPAMTSLLIVRGTRPQSSVVFIDGVWVPSVYHFGGFSSVVPTEAIESIDLYPGNFSARYGRATGGALEVRTRAIAPDGKYSGLAQVDMIDARVLAQGPVPGLPEWKFLLAGRRSHLDAWLPSVLPDDVSFRTAPIYYDYQGFVERRTEAHTLRIGVFGGDDRLALVSKNSSVSDPGFSAGLAARTGFWRAMISYEGKLSPAVRLALTASYGQNTERFRAGQINVWDRFHAFSMRGELSYRVAPTLTLRAGPDLLHYPYEVDLRTMAPPRPGEPDPGPMSNRPVLRMSGKGSLSAPAFYAEADWRPVPRAKLLFGARVDYLNKNRDTNASPRFNARYDLVQGPLRTTLRAGVGVFYEPPIPVEVVEVFGTPSVRANRAVHTSAGIEQELSPSADVSLEGFRKDLDQLVVRGTLPDGTYGYTNDGTGRVVGLEALLRYRPGGGRFFGWLAYTLSRSVRTDAPGQQEHLLEYDQTHILTAVASVDLGRGFQLGGRFRYVTGTPYTPCLDGSFDASVGAYACRSGTIHSARLPAFAQLDVRLDKTWQIGAGKLTAYVDLLNATNRKNTEAIGYNYNYSRTAPSYGIPFLPNLGLRGEF